MISIISVCLLRLDYFIIVGLFYSSSTVEGFSVYVNYTALTSLLASCILSLSLCFIFHRLDFFGIISLAVALFVVMKCRDLSFMVLVAWYGVDSTFDFYLIRRDLALETFRNKFSYLNHLIITSKYKSSYW